MLREGGVLKRYESIFVVHSVRTAAELAYANELKALAARHPGVLRYVPVGHARARQRLPRPAYPDDDRRRFARSVARIRARPGLCPRDGLRQPTIHGDMRALLRDKSFQPCRRGLIGSMLFENYWQ